MGRILFAVIVLASLVFAGISLANSAKNSMSKIKHIQVTAITGTRG